MRIFPTHHCGVCWFGIFCAQHVDQHWPCYVSRECPDDKGPMILVSKDERDDVDFMANSRVTQEAFDEALTEVKINDYFMHYRPNKKTEYVATLSELKARFHEDPHFRPLRTIEEHRQILPDFEETEFWRNLEKVVKDLQLREEYTATEELVQIAVKFKIVSESDSYKEKIKAILQFASFTFRHEEGQTMVYPPDKSKDIKRKMWKWLDLIAPRASVTVKAEAMPDDTGGRGDTSSISV